MFFELEDIKRRHSPYWDCHNVNSWVRTPDSTHSWMIERGVLIGCVSAFLNESIVALVSNARLLHKYYETPENLKQAGIFLKETMKLPSFRRAMWNRGQYSLAIGSTDIAARIYTFRYLNNGWQKPFGGFEWQFMRKIPGSILGALVSAPVGVPFELARLAFYADKTFPKELQRGYTSYFNALMRIPFEEGPYYLMRNSFPIYFRNFLQTFTLFYTFDFMKDKGSWMWRVGDVPYWPAKVGFAAFSSYLACVFSFPWAVTAQHMVDFHPKMQGVDIFEGNYRKAAVWLWYHDNSSNYFPGFFRTYFYRQFPWMFSTIYLADSLGIFSYWQIDIWSGPGTNSWEDSFV